MIARAEPWRRLKQVGEARLRAGRSGTLAAAIILATSAASAPAAQPYGAHSDTGSPDAVVEKLRQLPLPLRALPQGTAAAKATPPPLPAIESRRQQLFEQLHALGPASVDALARALRDPDPEMRRDVAVALDVIGGGWWHFPDGDAKVDLRPALPALLTALQDPDPGVRAWAAQDISDIGEAAATAVPNLRAMLHSPDAGSRGTACSALGRIGSAARGALPDLRAALSDSSPEVRQAARDAITSIERAIAAPAP